MYRIIAPILILIMFWEDSFSQNNDKIVRMTAIHDFPVLSREGMASNRKPYAPFHTEEDLNALAGDDLNFTFHMAAAEGVFPGKPGKYNIRVNTLTERDGECVYNVYVNDVRVGLFQQNPPTNEFSAPAMLQWTGVEIPARARIRVESNNWSNLLRHEDNFYEYARGRWTSVDFIPEEKVNRITDMDPDMGIFEKIETLGPAEFPAEARYEKVEKAYYLSASGLNEAKGTDRFGFLNKLVDEDFALETLLIPVSFNDNQAFEAGLMIRQSNIPGAPYLACFRKGNGAVALQYREAQEQVPKEIVFKITYAEMIQLEKKGQIFYVSAARFGEDYERHSIELSALAGKLRAGFFVCSNRSGQRELVRFSRVRYFEDTGKRMNH
jgi:hypothetical protein